MTPQRVRKHPRLVRWMPALLLAASSMFSGSALAGVCYPGDAGCLPPDPPPPYECNHGCAADCYNEILARCEELGRQPEDCALVYSYCIASCGCLNPEIPMTQRAPVSGQAAAPSLVAAVNPGPAMQSPVCGKRIVSLMRR